MKIKVPDDDDEIFGRKASATDVLTVSNNLILNIVQ